MFDASDQRIMAVKIVFFALPKHWKTIVDSVKAAALCLGSLHTNDLPYLKLTAKAPKNGGFQVRNLRDSRGPLFSEAMFVSFREGRLFTPLSSQGFGNPE